MASGRKRKRRPTKRPRCRTYSQVGGVAPGLLVGIGKTGYSITKAIGELQPKRADWTWSKANENAIRVNRSIVLSCDQTYKKTLVGPTRVSWKRWSLDRMDTAIVMCPEFDATWITTWRRATHAGNGSLALGAQEETPTAGSPTLTSPLPRKEKPSRFL